MFVLVLFTEISSPAAISTLSGSCVGCVEGEGEDDKERTVDVYWDNKESMQSNASSMLLLLSSSTEAAHEVVTARADGGEIVNGREVMGELLLWGRELHRL